MVEEIRIGNIIIKDFWLWDKVRIEEESCQECKNSDMITIMKGEKLTKLIKVLKRLNYKGIKKEWRK
jgi:hypothetical protein